MRPMKPITIVGGGLAGLTLGIGLRQNGVPVTVWEAGHYPRHRVCGEFINGDGREVLRELQLEKGLMSAGARQAHTASFMSRTASPVRRLPYPALCLSRYKLDALLAEEFTKVGGKLQEKSRWTVEDTAEGLVRASGRRSQATENGGRWFGLKVHARNVKLIADLEMHLVTNGYVGICQVAADVVNVCGLFRRTTKDERMPTNWRELLRSVPGTSLHRTMASAEFDESCFCAVAGLAMRPRKAAESDGCCVGDAITMIPPVTGNGMSMAFESAHHALTPLSAYSQGKLSWRKAREKIADRCDAAFHQHLTWARWLQWMMFTPILRGWAGSAAIRSDWLWKMLFAKTR